MTPLKIDHRTVSVLPLAYPNPEDADGLWRPLQGTIEVRQDIAPDEQARVLLHEILHALWASRGLPLRAGEERAVDALSAGLVTVFKDNPELTGKLMSAIGGEPLGL